MKCKRFYSFVTAVIMIFSMSILFSIKTIIPIEANAAYENTHINTGNQAYDIVEVAKTQIGYHEGSLEGTTSGSNNYTKYNEWFGSLSGYGKKYAWCQTFIAWCANQANIPTNVVPKVSGTVSGMEFFQDNGVWQDRNYTPSTGDIIYFYSNSSESGYHVGIVSGVSNGYIYTIEGNYSNKVSEHSVVLGSSSIVGYGCPNYSRVNKDTEPPTISDIQVYDVSVSGYSIAVHGTDSGSGISQVRFPTWTIYNDQDDIIWADGDYVGEHAYFRVNTSDHNNELSWYITHIYAYDNAGNVSSAPVNDVLIENENPVISEVEVFDISTSGYTVRAKVIDSGSGINRVQFPTWTHENGQDDLIVDCGSNNSARGTFDGDYVTYRVNVSDHNGEMGWYCTHIYAYDNCGNIASGATPNVLIENEEPDISDVEVFDVSETGYSIRAKVSDSGSGINRVQFPTWTKENGQDDIFANWQVNPAASGTIDGNTVIYRVNASEHNNELGIYQTHIYVYDNCGNCRQYRVDEVDLSAVAPTGDCNKDGEFTVADIVQLQKYLLGNGTLTN